MGCSLKRMHVGRWIFGILAAAMMTGAGPAKVKPLGDLSSDIKIAKDTLKIAENGDLKGAKARIKDLETAWDEAEEKQRPMSPDDWETADQAIDKALAKCRSSKPHQDAIVESLRTLIETLERLQGGAK